MKASYLEGLSQLAYDAPEVSEGDIEDAMMLPQEKPPGPSDDDSTMEEPPDEEDDIEAMIASYEERTAQISQGPQSPPMSDDDYDDIFAELIAQERQTLQNHTAPGEQMEDTVFEDSAMSF